MEENRDRVEKKLKIDIKDWGSKEVSPGTTILELVGEIERGGPKAALAARINGKVVDLHTPLQENSRLEILTFDDAEGAQIYHHTASHVLAQAVKTLSRCPSRDWAAYQQRVYYDFDFCNAHQPEDLEK